MVPWCTRPPITTSTVTEAQSPWGMSMPVVSRIDASSATPTRAQWIQAA